MWDFAVSQHLRLRRPGGAVAGKSVCRAGASGSRLRRCVLVPWRFALRRTSGGGKRAGRGACGKRRANLAAETPQTIVKSQENPGPTRFDNRRVIKSQEKTGSAGLTIGRLWCRMKRVCEGAVGGSSCQPVRVLSQVECLCTAKGLWAAPVVCRERTAAVGRTLPVVQSGGGYREPEP